ncbi:MAG: sigma-54-dependent Fis family transcriptional regulator [Pantoea sp.]|nr:sigma-54-dependent Fis family transcriptional regulator [Pantoea sp.]
MVKAITTSTRCPAQESRRTGHADLSPLNSPALTGCAFPTADIHAHLHKLVETIAPLNVDVLLEGETGTGKDTLARRIYERSGCRGPLVPVNCGAIPETLAESELFGVVSGAYTGASHSRPGYIEAANNGILFLDEIDSMPLTVQAKLLRMLETRAIERLGSTRCIPLTLRVIAAAQTPLEQLVTQGRFRRDLYFRLNTITLATPTVRSRPELIIPLFRQFTQDAAQRLDQPLPPRAPGLDEALLLHNWPGNIRELKAAAERFVLGLPPLCQQAIPQAELVHELGIPRRTLYHRLKQLKLSA